jgi:hypothetical protein
VDRRVPGAPLPFGVAHGVIKQWLSAAVEERALRQYVSVLAGRRMSKASNSARRIRRWFSDPCQSEREPCKT